MKSLTRFAASLLLGAVAATAAVSANAKVVAFATRATNFSFNTATALVPLNSSGATSVTFNSNKPTQMVLTFSAECSASGGTVDSWLDLDVLVNGTPVSPTNQVSDGFCHSTGTASFGQWVRPSITVVIPVIAGNNTVQILARLDGVTGGWVSDTSLVIHQ